LLPIRSRTLVAYRQAFSVGSRARLSETSSTWSYNRSMSSSVGSSPWISQASVDAGRRVPMDWEMDDNNEDDDDGVITKA
jgi:hypothetical protein